MKQDLNRTRLDRSTNKDVQDWITIRHDKKATQDLCRSRVVRKYTGDMQKQGTRKGWK